MVRQHSIYSYSRLRHGRILPGPEWKPRRIHCILVVCFVLNESGSTMSLLSTSMNSSLHLSVDLLSTLIVSLQVDPAFLGSFP